MRDIKEIEGKTIDKVSFSEDIFVLLCTNGDLYGIEADGGYPETGPYLSLTESFGGLDHGLGDGILMELGLLTKEQLAQKFENDRKEKAGRERQAAWEQYQKLKEQFENEERVEQTTV